MLGTMDSPSEDVYGASSKADAVVALYPATDLVAFSEATNGSNALLSLFAGAYLGASAPPESREAQLFRQASPVSHVSPGDAVFLLIHRDADRIVPISQSELLRSALAEQGVGVEFIRVPCGGHGDAAFTADGAAEYFETMIEWLDVHLRTDRR